MPHQPSINKSLAKSAGIIGLATLLSRILGFVRDIIIAKLFGTALSAQAFVVAFRIPNLLRDLVGEGATNAAFVPIFSEYLTLRKKEEFWGLASCILNLMIVILMALTILGIVFAPLIVRLIAPGFMADPEKLRLTIKLTRVMFPYLLLIGLTAYAMGVLNSLKHFTLPAFGPCLLNISMIVIPMFLYPRMRESVMALAIAVLIGGVAQLAIQIPMLYKKGMVFGRDRLKFFHPAAKRIGKLLIPRALGSAVYQINIFVNTILASLASVVGEGGVAAIYYSNRIFQFPLAVFGIAIATAALPTMSFQAAESNLKQLKETISFSLRSVFFIMIPSTVGLMVLSTPIIKVLFERGKFDQYSTAITSNALFFYSIGLFAYSGIKILVSSFYSLQDTFTPVKAASISLVINLILNFIFMWPLGVGGLALATAISAIFNLGLLFFILKKRIGDLDEKRIFKSFLRISLASLIMGFVCWFLVKKSNYNFLGESELLLRGLLIPICVGVGVFLMISFILKVEELRMVTRWILKKG